MIACTSPAPWLRELPAVDTSASCTPLRASSTVTIPDLTCARHSMSSIPRREGGREGACARHISGSCETRATHKKGVRRSCKLGSRRDATLTMTWHGDVGGEPFHKSSSEMTINRHGGGDIVRILPPVPCMYHGHPQPVTGGAAVRLPIRTQHRPAGADLSFSWAARPVFAPKQLMVLTYGVYTLCESRHRGFGFLVALPPVSTQDVSPPLDCHSDGQLCRVILASST